MTIAGGWEIFLCLVAYTPDRWCAIKDDVQLYANSKTELEKKMDEWDANIQNRANVL